MTPAFALHGGAGVMLPANFPAGRRERIEVVLREIAIDAWRALQAGSSALDVVEQAVASLEDCEYFNAGRGAVLNRDGVAELDAAIMDGRNRACGAIAGALSPRNPIRLARAVMARTEHVLLVGPAADRFAVEAGIERAPGKYFITAERVAQWEAAAAEGRVSLAYEAQVVAPADAAAGAEPAAAEVERRSGTVGAVARDRGGHLAAATSTGGMTYKLPGRAGDAAVIGAGTFADDASCAVSGTGHGEYFIRAVLGHDVHARIAYAGLGLADAANAAMTAVERLGGIGGLIAVGRTGSAVLPFNSPGMYRAWVDESGHVRTAIFR